MKISATKEIKVPSFIAVVIQYFSFKLKELSQRRVNFFSEIALIKSWQQNAMRVAIHDCIKRNKFSTKSKVFVM